MGRSRAAPARTDIQIRVPNEDERSAIDRISSIVFSHRPQPAELERRAAVLDLERFRIAVDPGIDTPTAAVIGSAGSIAFDMTLPGGATLPIGGVTGVGVLPTHRRRGLMRRLLESVHTDIAQRSEPVSALFASEGGIYERFGYGIAALHRKVEIDCRRVAWRPDIDELTATDGPVTLLADGDPVDELAPRWDRYRATRPGELSRSEPWWRSQLDDTGEVLRAVHADGYASWSVTPNWNDGRPAHVMNLSQLVASTPQAHRALWRTVLGVDLVATVVTWELPLDDPLPHLLVDRRAVRTCEVDDSLWVRVDDIAAAFGTRVYGTDDSVVIEVDGERWQIGHDQVRTVRRRPDLVTDRSGLSALLLAGVRPSELVAARRIEARSAVAAQRADAMFVTGPMPQCSTGF